MTDTGCRYIHLLYCNSEMNVNQSIVKYIIIISIDLFIFILIFNLCLLCRKVKIKMGLYFVSLNCDNDNECQ